METRKYIIARQEGEKTALYNAKNEHGIAYVSEYNGKAIKALVEELKRLGVELEGDCIFSDDYFSMMPGEEKTVILDANSELGKILMGAQ